MARLWTVLLVLLLLGAASAKGAAPKSTPATAAGGAAVTFSESVAPILYSNCVTCHRPGEAAPFSLISYADARKKGRLIAEVTESRYMPPWRAAHGYGEFADERRLTEAQIATLAQWVEQGMPDLVLKMPAAYELPASGPDIYRNFVIPTHLTENKWVRAVEFRPAARK